MSGIPASLRRTVLRRARGRCEYCRLSQEGQEATFHVDHVVPLVERGPTALDNLALCCVSCSLRKGARRTSTDPSTGRDSALFNPRAEAWSDHFEWGGVVLIPVTSVGRATEALLQLNRPMILAIRDAEARMGRHPPD
jgi:hypothetical protein